MSNIAQMEFRALYVIIACTVFFTNKSIQVNVENDQRAPVVQTESGAVVGKIETVPHSKAVYQQEYPTRKISKVIGYRSQ